MSMRQTKPFLAKHKWDVILLSALCLLSLLGLLLARLVRTDGQYVVVTHNHEIVGKYDLSKDQTIPLSVSDGTYNLLVIEDHSAIVTEANCPDKLCVFQRRIRYTGQRIICLPHRLMVEIVGGEGYDFVISPASTQKGGQP